MTQTYLKEERTITMNGKYKPSEGIWLGWDQGAVLVGGIDNKIEKRKQPCPFK